MYCTGGGVQIRALTLLVVVVLTPVETSAQGARFVVRVVDYAGRAVPEAQVALFRVEADDTLTRVASDTTGDTAWSSSW